jgi:hypothetical protein
MTPPLGWNKPEGKLTRGLDTPQPYREDAIIRIRHMEAEIAGIQKAMEEVEGEIGMGPDRGEGKLRELGDKWGAFGKATRPSKQKDGEYTHG